MRSSGFCGHGSDCLHHPLLRRPLAVGGGYRRSQQPAKAWLGLFFIGLKGAPFSTLQPPSRDRVLTDAELAEIWAPCQDNDCGKIVKLALLTGARREEIGGLAWQEIDIERAELNLPPDRPKNRRPHIVPLSPVARRLLLRRLRREGREYLSFVWMQSVS